MVPSKEKFAKIGNKLPNTLIIAQHWQNVDIVIAISKKYNSIEKMYSFSKSNLSNFLVQTQIRKMGVIGFFVDEIFSSLNL
jgi:hypothetical protein